jgi:hypothetical protein
MIEVPFEGGQGPEEAVALYMEGSGQFLSDLSQNRKVPTRFN